MTLFMDIDGVLNGHKVQDNGHCGIDSTCAAFLNAVIDEFDPDIVIHSAWRYLVLNGSMNLDGFAAMLATHGVKVYRTGTLAHRIVAVTRMDDADGSENDRAAQILEHAATLDGPWIAVDDLDLPLPAEHFVKTNGVCGLYGSTGIRFGEAVRNASLTVLESAPEVKG